jgi:hypothetical protein
MPDHDDLPAPRSDASRPEPPRGAVPARPNAPPRPEPEPEEVPELLGERSDYPLPRGEE